MPFLGIESGRDEPVPRGDGQIGLSDPERDLLTIELTELKNEVLGDGGPVHVEEQQRSVHDLPCQTASAAPRKRGCTDLCAPDRPDVMIRRGCCGNSAW